MGFLLQNARLCMDCDTVFEEPRCPSCGGESYHPLSRWVRPAIVGQASALKKNAKTASLVLLGSGLAYGAWRMLQKPDGKKEPSEK